MILCFVWRLLWLHQQKIWGIITVLCVEIIVVTEPLNIVKCYCFVCGVYCGYSNSRYRAMVLCCEWRLFWLKLQ